MLDALAEHLKEKWIKKVDGTNVALCVVDMQYGFWYSGQHACEKVQKRMLEALRDGNKLIVVEYDGYDQTHESIKRIANMFPKRDVLYVTKIHNGGGKEVLASVDKAGWDFIKEINICGINRCYCVYSTAVQIAESIKVNFLSEATHCADGCSCLNDPSVYKNILSRYKKNKVNVIKEKNS